MTLANYSNVVYMHEIIHAHNIVSKGEKLSFIISILYSIINTHIFHALRATSYIVFQDVYLLSVFQKLQIVMAITLV